MVSPITVSRGNVQFKNKKALRIHHVKETWATLKKNLKQKLKHIISIAPKLREGGWASQINPSLRKQNTTDKSTDRVKVFLTRKSSGLASKLPGQKEIVRPISLKKKSILTHIYGSQKDGIINTLYETAKETLMYTTVLWTLWEKERVGRFGRMALKHVKYHV